jgi:hypothetical protein
MRSVSMRDLPGVLRQMRVPAHIRRQMMHGLGALGVIQPGNYSDGDPNVGERDDGGTDPTENYYATTPGDDTSGSPMSVIASTPGDAPGFSSIIYTCINFRTSAPQSNNNSIPANPNRVVLIVQNQHATDDMVVNFGQGASVQSVAVVGPPAATVLVTNGLLINPGGNLFLDTYCSTDAIYVRGLNDTNCAIIQGTRGPVVSS